MDTYRPHYRYIHGWTLLKTENARHTQKDDWSHSRCH